MQRLSCLSLLRGIARLVHGRDWWAGLYGASRRIGTVRREDVPRSGRDRAAYSYAKVVKLAAPAVVNVYV